MKFITWVCFWRCSNCCRWCDVFEALQSPHKFDLIKSFWMDLTGSNANYDRWLRDSVLLSLSIKFYVNIHVLFCLTFVSILDWVMRGWSCLSHLCTILMGHSDIVEVIIFFKPSQCSYHIFTHWAGIAIVQNLLNSRDSGDYLDESGGSGESRQGPWIWLIWWMWLIWLICTFR